MSTNAYIAILENDTVKYIYVHNDMVILNIQVNYC